MQPAGQQKPCSSWSDWMLAGIFVLLISLPAVDKIFHLDRAAQPMENRFLARKPELKELRSGHVREFLAASEAYFNDHFGFRKQLIIWSQNWKQEIYHQGSLYHMVTGPHQWQFYGENQMVEHYLGWLKFTPRQLEAWRTLLEKRRDWLAQRHIQYLLVIAPDKQTIYPEELPAWLNNAPSDNRQTKLDQFLAYMKEHSTVQILDLRKPLIAAKKTAPTYLQHDTHWNFFGGFVACQQVVNSLAEFPDLPALRLADFTWTNVPSKAGDLAPDVEGNYFEFHPKANLPALVLDTTNIISDWDVPRKVFIVENPAPLARTAVIFHDSFGLAWRSFLGYEFKRVVFLPDNREFNAGLISANKPDVVINEVVERQFDTLDPEDLMARDALR